MQAQVSTVASGMEGMSSIGPAPRMVTTAIAATGDHAPSTEARTGEVANATSLRVAAIPKARGIPEGSTRWLSSVRIYP